MTPEERLVIAILRGVVVRGEAFERGCWPVADAGGECMDALDEARVKVGFVEHESGQAQHDVDLGGGVVGERVHCRAQRAGGDRRVEVGEKTDCGAVEFAAGNGVETLAEDVEQKQALPESVGAVAHQGQDGFADCMEVWWKLGCGFLGPVYCKRESCWVGRSRVGREQVRC